MQIVQCSITNNFKQTLKRDIEMGGVGNKNKNKNSTHTF